ncbi:hypothetical protein BDW74DRAFT_156767 [Aspergillus multicolor]|uniref:uncharacterized protein n=1 Tax=Aspergillus multicolor TaxID=41759 RepID=UPI003CCDD8B7
MTLRGDTFLLEQLLLVGNVHGRRKPATWNLVPCHAGASVSSSYTLISRHYQSLIVDHETPLSGLHLFWPFGFGSRTSWFRPGASILAAKLLISRCWIPRNCTIRASKKVAG